MRSLAGDDLRAILSHEGKVVRASAGEGAALFSAQPFKAHCIAFSCSGHLHISPGHGQAGLCRRIFLDHFRETDNRKKTLTAVHRRVHSEQDHCLCCSCRLLTGKI